MFKYKINMISGKTHYAEFNVEEKDIMDYISTSDYIQGLEGAYIIVNHIESVKVM